MKGTLAFLGFLAGLIGVALFAPKQVGSVALTLAVLSIAGWFIIRIVRD